ncbi:MAG: type VI secretion system baseplate subunit TssF [candidate division Zixibacteria bacterium]|nr:type VI secretion system baseplate subunit TssF [candidate division Zixibacteria bacterium]
MFNKYYQDELTYLRQLGEEFARAYPKLAPMLSETGADPDVERLLEGFAFLAGRIRQKLDGDLPELAHNFVNLLWPHYLRPVPSATILEFDPSGAALQETQKIPRGASVESVPVEGSRCRFQTTSDVTVYPFSLKETSLEAPSTGAPFLRLGFQMGKADLSKIRLADLSLFLSGEPQTAYGLYLFLTHHLKRVVFRSPAAKKERAFGPEVLRSGGWEEAEALLPYPVPAFSGYRLLQEYFTLPEKFLFLQLPDISPLARLEIKERFEIIFEFNRRPEEAVRVKPGTVRLYCTPAVNLFPHRATPIRVEEEKTEYRLRPEGTNTDHYEIFSVSKVSGWTAGTVEEKEYRPFFSYEHSLGDSGRKTEYYHLTLRPAVVGRGTETYISFVTGDETAAIPSTSTVAVELVCSSRNLAEKLKPGDVNVPTGESPAFASFQNITKVTPSIPPPLEAGVLWRLISHLSLNYLSLLSVENLRGVLELYNFAALFDRQAARAGELRLEGIRQIKSKPDHLFLKGDILRGLKVELELAESGFAAEGEMYLFASILNRFFGLYTSLNSFSRLEVKGLEKGETYRFAPTAGRQVLL